jgi:membrane protein implicated in regulation of membrane protease activity
MMIVVWLIVGWMALSLMAAMLWWRFHKHIGHSDSDEERLRRLL